MTDRLELQKASVQKIDDDILLTQYKSGNKIKVDDAKEIDNAHITMAQGQEMFVIADFSVGNIAFDKDAEDYFVTKGKMIPYTKGIAIITNKKSSIFNRLFSQVRKTLYPTKEFLTMDNALEWINKQKS